MVKLLIVTILELIFACT